MFEDESMRLWTVAARAPDGAPLDDVLIASIKTKVHAIGPGVIAGLLKGIELAEASYRGLVIWSADEPELTPEMAASFLAGHLRRPARARALQVILEEHNALIEERMSALKWD